VSVDEITLSLTSIEVRVGRLQQEFWNNPMCGERLREIQDGEVWTSQCSPHIAGQYVSVQKIGTGKLSMCEVAVYARLGEYLLPYFIQPRKCFKSMVLETVRTIYFCCDWRITETFSLRL
jgi:hypothetical protein